MKLLIVKAIEIRTKYFSGSQKLSARGCSKTNAPLLSRSLAASARPASLSLHSNNASSTRIFSISFDNWSRFKLSHSTSWSNEFLASMVMTTVRIVKLRTSPSFCCSILQHNVRTSTKQSNNFVFVFFVVRHKPHRVFVRTQFFLYQLVSSQQSYNFLNDATRRRRQDSFEKWQHVHTCWKRCSRLPVFRRRRRGRSWNSLTPSICMHSRSSKTEFISCSPLIRFSVQQFIVGKNRESAMNWFNS